MDINISKISLTIDGTDQCVGRDCEMCSGFNSKKCTSYFSLAQQAILLKELNELGLKVRFTVTGGGEPLLTPDLPELMKGFLSYKKICGLNIVTSGFLQEEEFERKQLESVMSLPGAQNIIVALSFHLLGKTFPRRFKETLGYLLRNAPLWEIGVKMTYTPENIVDTYNKMHAIFGEIIEEDKRFVNFLMRSLDYEDKDSLSFIKSNFLENLVDKYSSLNKDRIIYNSLLYPASYIFFPEKEPDQKVDVYVIPQHYSPKGKGRNMRQGRINKYLCPTLFNDDGWIINGDTIKIHVGSDGYYYPSCGCPYLAKLRIGQLGIDPIKKIMVNLANFNLKVAKKMRTRTLDFINRVPCDECAELCHNFMQIRR